MLWARPVLPCSGLCLIAVLWAPPYCRAALAPSYCWMLRTPAGPQAASPANTATPSLREELQQDREVSVSREHPLPCPHCCCPYVAPSLVTLVACLTLAVRHSLSLHITLSRCTTLLLCINLLLRISLTLCVTLSHYALLLLCITLYCASPLSILRVD